MKHETPPEGSPVNELLAHPKVVFLLGFIAVAFSVFTYYDGITKPNIIFLVHPTRTPIVQAGKVSDLSVSLRGKAVSGDLTAAQFAIWNSGKTPVRHEDILKPILLMTSSNIPIYEATIRNASREVIGFQLITNDLASGRLSFDWRILEHNDGASIQVLYGGDQKMSFQGGEGIMVGQSSVPFEVLNTQIKTFKQTILVALILLTVAIGAANVMRISIVRCVDALRGKQVGAVFFDFLSSILFGFFTVLLVLYAWRLFSIKNAPPFDF